MCDNTSFDDRIKETQNKKGILDKKKRKPNYFLVILTKEDRAADRVDLSWGNENLNIIRYEKWLWMAFLELFYKRNRKKILLCLYTVIETLVEVWENSK